MNSTAASRPAVVAYMGLASHVCLAKQCGLLSDGLAEVARSAQSLRTTVAPHSTVLRS